MRPAATAQAAKPTLARGGLRLDTTRPRAISKAPFATRTNDMLLRLERAEQQRAVPLRAWTPAQQRAAIRLLVHQPCVTALNLSGVGLRVRSRHG